MLNRTVCVCGQELGQAVCVCAAGMGRERDDPLYILREGVEGVHVT